MGRVHMSYRTENKERKKQVIDGDVKCCREYPFLLLAWCKKCQGSAWMSKLNRI